MTWAREVIAHHRRRVSADENGSGVPDVVCDVFGLSHQHLDVFGRNVIYEFDGVFLVSDYERDAPVDHSQSSDCFTVQQFQLRLDLIENRRGNTLRPADQPDTRHLVMLGLCEQVCGDP